jgi:RNA polymerase sigma-70 factor (ECF subfamily)
MTPPSEHGSSIGSTSSSLLQRVQGQDADAWRRLVRLYGPLIDYWVRRGGLQPADAEDVFQDVFRAVAAHIGTFTRDRATGSFRGWLRTITRSKLADHFRRRGQQPEAVGGSPHQR